ncbi:hypothetical protein C8F04DRAFT_1349494 [Mycena alexandri]|uniref:Uncharacterized protein n=1 Tax=Mycena alexandri TaxID=1745969 RepID=A0AAD6SYW8_9AGAR|nr:hypothetical protein C8F04DRAFT_1349494 [Mycena alexandri]
MLAWCRVPDGSLENPSSPVQLRRIRNMERDHRLPSFLVELEPIRDGGPFIVKVQLAAADASNLPAIIGQPVDSWARDGQSLLIYDRHAWMEVTLDKLSAEAVKFDTVAGLVREKGFRSLRLFCWPIRSGDWTLRLCLDHLPEEKMVDSYTGIFGLVAKKVNDGRRFTST